MAWNDGVNVATGDLITASAWNNYLGLTGSLMYLKTETDKLDDVSHTEPTRALGTIYQNTGGKIRFISVNLGASANGSATLYCDANASPTDVIASTTVETSLFGFLASIIPPSWYYKVVVGSGTLNIQEWHEWDEH